MLNFVMRIFLLIFLCYFFTNNVAGSANLCEIELCKCSKFSANCKGKTITYVNESIFVPDFINAVDLSSNKISETENLNFKSVSKMLKVLDLSSNENREISDQSLRMFSSLKTLSFRNNLIESVHEKAFENMKELNVLNLSFNKISFLPNGVFDSLLHLHLLDLSFNPIKSFHENIFSRLQQLKNLDMAGLKLQYMPERIFSSNMSISHLDISLNSLNAIPSGSLWSLQNTLKHLDISGNKFETIESSSFYGLHRIKVLKMERLLNLKTIEEFAFDGLLALETIELRYLPKLREIKSKAFRLKIGEKLHKILFCPIRDITIEFSTLNCLPEELLVWNQLRYAKLQNNRWDCNCDMKWVKNSTLEKLTGELMFCFSPLSLRGKTIQKLNEDDLSCSALDMDSKSEIVAILLIIIFAMLISFTTVCIFVYRRNGWLLNPPRINYNRLESQMSTITVFDRGSVISFGNDFNNIANAANVIDD